MVLAQTTPTLRVQHIAPETALRVPTPRVQQSMIASALRVKAPTQTLLHNGPAPRTRSCLLPVLCKDGNSPAVSTPPKPSPPPKPPGRPPQTGPAAGTRLQGTQNLVQALGTAYDLGNTSSTKQLFRPVFPTRIFNVAFAVLDATL